MPDDNMSLMLRRKRLFSGICVVMFLTLFSIKLFAEDSLTYIEEFGKRLFFEESLSFNGDMSCATCHTSDTGGTNGNSLQNAEQVAVTGSNGGNGKLKPPTNKYVQFMGEDRRLKGVANFDPLCATFRGPQPCGGAFWNGRAKGDMIEMEDNIALFDGLAPHYEFLYRKYVGPLSDQAHASPFINSVEQALPNKKAVCRAVKDQPWGNHLYKFTFGVRLRCGSQYIDQTFAYFALALAAWQASDANNPFDSKRDIALRDEAAFEEDVNFPLAGLTDEENLGHDIFYNVEGATPGNCVFCHRSGNVFGTTADERYTDDQYHNIGVPNNPEIPGNLGADPGVSATTFDPRHLGQHKTPTLRNVDKRPEQSFVKAYTHNGWFKSLDDLVHFYNSAVAPNSLDQCGTNPVFDTACSFGITRCDNTQDWTIEEAKAANCWPEAEFTDTVTPPFVLGNLRLTKDEEKALVAYLKTLSDTSEASDPEPYVKKGFQSGRVQGIHLIKQ
ncbi:cytochrome-c peroxidase [Thaumasiovibrio sp. DFM-14]|uniref:cytochrome-c peroxidase n=1 Tax=Thaumasiovibrio sp. DFM-14 TaxID=3384792 RepID=UPI00399FEA02